MGRSYNLKKSPINKGTAAKPSPAKDFGAISGPLIAAAITAAASAGTAAYQGKKNRKAQEKISKEQEAAAATQSAQEGIGGKQIGSSTKLV